MPAHKQSSHHLGRRSAATSSETDSRSQSRHQPGRVEEVRTNIDVKLDNRNLDEMVEQLSDSADNTVSSAEYLLDEWSDRDEREASREKLSGEVGCFPIDLTGASETTTPAVAATSAQQATPIQQPTQGQRPTPVQQHAPTVPAGWYPDPDGMGQRYWDGYQWTPHTATW